jgi:hypothetical protein
MLWFEWFGRCCKGSNASNWRALWWVSTSELDNLAAETASMTIAHPDYAQLAARIAISICTRITKSFSETMTEMFNYVNPRNGQYSINGWWCLQSNSR